MEDMRCVQVPDGLASELAADGFGEVSTFRGVGDQAVLTITSVAANLGAHPRSGAASFMSAGNRRDVPGEAG